MFGGRQISVIRSCAVACPIAVASADYQRLCCQPMSMAAPKFQSKRRAMAMGAVCALFEPWGQRVWNGEKVVVPEEHRELAKKMMWW